MNKNDVDRYQFLDALRGLAIIWVVYHHVLVGLRDHFGPVLRYIVGEGYLGVNIFFVISGYGIAASLTNNARYLSNPHEFLWRRLNRIYTTYWWHFLFAAIIIPVVIAAMMTVKTHSFDPNWINYSKSEWLQMITLTKVFSATSWRLDYAFEPLNGPIWFVSIVVQIYLFVTICLYSKKYLNLCLFIGFIVSLFTYIPYIKKLLPYGLFLPYFPLFYVGIGVYFALKNGLTPRSWLMKWIILIGLVAAAIYCELNQYYNIFSLLFSALTGYVILILKVYDRQISNWKLVRVFSLLGIFSYSLYLIHIPLWRLVGIFVSKLIPLSAELQNALFLAPSLIILSYFWFLFFERPSSQSQLLTGLASPIKTVVSGIDLAKNVLRLGRYKSDYSLLR